MEYDFRNPHYSRHLCHFYLKNSLFNLNKSKDVKSCQLNNLPFLKYSGFNMYPDSPFSWNRPSLRSIIAPRVWKFNATENIKKRKNVNKFYGFVEITWIFLKVLQSNMNVSREYFISINALDLQAPVNCFPQPQTVRYNFSNYHTDERIGPSNSYK